jgi:hypothetical protein
MKYEQKLLYSDNDEFGEDFVERLTKDNWEIIQILTIHSRWAALCRREKLVK